MKRCGKAPEFQIGRTTEQNAASTVSQAAASSFLLLMCPVRITAESTAVKGSPLADLSVVCTFSLRTRE